MRAIAAGRAVLGVRRRGDVHRVQVAFRPWMNRDRSLHHQHGDVVVVPGAQPPDDVLCDALGDTRGGSTSQPVSTSARRSSPKACRPSTPPCASVTPSL